jgi:hypothetical protein
MIWQSGIILCSNAGSFLAVVVVFHVDQETDEFHSGHKTDEIWKQA